MKVWVCKINLHLRFFIFTRRTTRVIKSSYSNVFESPALNVRRKTLCPFLLWRTGISMFSLKSQSHSGLFLKRTVVPFVMVWHNLARDFTYTRFVYIFHIDENYWKPSRWKFSMIIRLKIPWINTDKSQCCTIWRSTRTFMVLICSSLVQLLGNP